MPPGETLLTLTICGQRFSLRASDDDARRFKKVAARIDERIAERKRAGVSTDLRAALMTALEMLEGKRVPKAPKKHANLL